MRLGTIVSPALQMKKPRQREIKQLPMVTLQPDGRAET